MKKIYAILFFLMFAFSIFSSINFSVAGDLSSLKINLINDAKDYETYGFKDLGIYYTPQALCEFHMPFAVPKKDSGSLTKNDISGNLLNTPSNLAARKPTLKYTILAENDNYYIIDYQMNIEASTSKFSVDFIPSVKGKSFSEFAWWNSNWDHAKLVTVDYSKVEGVTDLIDFPILVYLDADSDIGANCQNDIDDLAFVSIDNATQLKHEIENYSFSGNELSANIWLKIPTLSYNTDTRFWIYYDNPVASSQEDAANTWNSDYLGVYHLNETTGSICYDSTGNNNDGTYEGDLPTSISSKVCNGQDFDGTGDYVNFTGSGLWMSGSDFGTVEAFVDLDTNTDTKKVLTQSDNASDNRFYLGTYDDNWYVYGRSGNVAQWGNFTTTFSIDTSYYTCLAMATNNITFWVDNNIIYIDKVATMPAGSFGFNGIGNSKDLAVGTYFNGQIDEVRFSNVKRNEGWINTTYNTINSPSTFLSFGASQDRTIFSITDHYPVNGSIDISPHAQNVSVTLFKQYENAMSVYFKGNTSNTWVTFGSNISVDNGTYHQINTNFSGFDTKYWWSANATNGSAWVNNTYYFTTRTAYTPSNPSSNNAVLEDSTTINITWTKGTYADNTLVVMKADSYPSSRTDGTIMYNGTLLTNTDSSYNSTRYYALYSWNSTDDLFSSGVNVEWGSLTVNVFNESSGLAISNWDVFITNPVTLETYENNANNNPLIIDVDDVPNGDDITIQVSATGYKTRQYVMDLATNTQYTLNAHLAQENDTELYEITVVGPQGEYTSQPVEGVRVEFNRYINSTVGWENIAIKHTDANGKFNIYLIPDIIYQVNLSKDDYDTATAFYTPDTTDHTKEFRILPSEVVSDIYILFWDTITLTGTMDKPGYLLSSNITVVYVDSNSSTVNWHFVITDLFNNTVMHDSVTYTSQSETIIISGFNNTRTYLLTLWFNNSASFDVVSPVSILVTSTYTYRGDRVPVDIEDRMDKIFGPFTVDGVNVGWASIISVSLALIVFVLFGPFNAGLGIIGCGMMIGFTQAMFGLVFSNAFNPMLTLLAPVCIGIGILYIWSKGDPGVHL